MNEIVDASNLANMYLCAGQTKEALKMHHQAVDGMCKVGNSCDQFESYTSYIRSTWNLSIPTTIFHPIPNVFADSGSFVYSHAALTPKQPEVFWMSDFARQSYNCRILYNCALAHHLIGLQQGRAALLYKALLYYTMARTTLTDVIDGNDEIRLFMAILNNMAQIHYELCDFDSAQRNFDELCSVVLHSNNVKSFVVVGTNGRLMYDRHSADMFFNAMLLRGNPPSARAA